MNATDSEILKSILGYCDKLERRIAQYQITEESFNSNDVYTDMLLMPIFQIGELAGKLSGECTKELNMIPWHQIRAFRNVIAHDYGAVRLDWAWKTATEDAPDLRIYLACYLESGLAYDRAARDCIARAKQSSSILNQSRASNQTTLDKTKNNSVEK